jgi:hypothetical protein
MSQNNEDEVILSETIAGQDEVGGVKLVPVTEPIRYRKRAQAAEKRSEILAEQLAQAKSENSQISEQLRVIQAEQQLMCKLAAVGTRDLEAAVLVAKERMRGSDDADLDGVVEQLKKEKQYLFESRANELVTAKKTASVKERVQTSRGVLEKAAERAAETGNRADLQEYLKLRRNFV